MLNSGHITAQNIARQMSWSTTVVGQIWCLALSCLTYAGKITLWPDSSRILAMSAINFRLDIKQGHKPKLTHLYAHWIILGASFSKYQNGMPEKPLILGRSGTQYVAMVAKLLSSYCGAHLVESYRKESNISG